MCWINFVCMIKYANRTEHVFSMLADDKSIDETQTDMNPVRLTMIGSR